jgi:hypothetical protein
MDVCSRCGALWLPFSGFVDDREHLVCAGCMSEELIAETGFPVRNSRKAGQGSKWIRRERRWAFYARDGWTCLYCGLRPVDDAPLSLDHFFPVSKEATDEQKAKSATPDNIVTLCIACNSARQDVPTATFVRRLEERGLDPAEIVRRVNRQRARRFDPIVLSPWRPVRAQLEHLRRRSMTPVDYAATTSRLLDAVVEAAGKRKNAASVAAATAAKALAETIRTTGVGGIEGARAAQLARTASAATGLDVGLAAASILIRDAPGILDREVWAEEQRDQRAHELRLLLEALAE